MSNWYHAVFRLPIVEGISSIILGDPNQGFIEFMKEPFGGHCHVAIRVSDFEAVVETFKSRGFELEVPKVKPGLKAAFLKAPDPAGNRVHLIWRR